MPTNSGRVDEQIQVKRYKIQYPISAYTFPQKALIHTIRFDQEYMHITLSDGRILSIPLWWIPTLYNAAPEQREKYEISRDRMTIVWDPEKSEINEDLNILDFLGPTRKDNAQQ